MKTKEVLNECLEMIASGADMVEIFEWLDVYTDFDTAEIVNEIYKKEVFI